jgi:hypothetical protein
LLLPVRMENAVGKDEFGDGKNVRWVFKADIDAPA